MMRKLCALLVVAMLAGCGSTEERNTAGKNPAEHCRQQGLSRGSDEYAGCISGYINQVCTERGLEIGTEDFRRCESNLREATFLRQQLQMRGY